MTLKNRFLSRYLRLMQMQKYIYNLAIISLWIAINACSPTSPRDSTDNELMSTNNSDIINDEMRSDEQPSEQSLDEMSDPSSSPAINRDMLDDQNSISSPDLLVGKGAQEFIAIEDGAVSTLHRGCQGAQHLWVSLRLPRHQPDAYSLELKLVNQDDELLAPPFTLEEEQWLGYDVSNQTQQGSEIIGLTLVIFDPMAVVGEQALIKTKVSINQEVLESYVWVQVQWGADAC